MYVCTVDELDRETQPATLEYRADEQTEQRSRNNVVNYLDKVDSDNRLAVIDQVTYLYALICFDVMMSLPVTSCISAVCLV